MKTDLSEKVPRRKLVLVPTNFHRRSDDSGSQLSIDEWSKLTVEDMFAAADEAVNTELQDNKAVV